MSPLDPYLFGFLNTGPDPHWGKMLDSDPFLNQCGSATPISNTICVSVADPGSGAFLTPASEIRDR